MDLTKIILSPEEIAELNGPFTQKHAREAVALGFARALAENGLVPSEVEVLMKSAGMDWLSLPGQYALLGLGLGAVGGAYSGHVRHNMEQSLAGNQDPSVVALKKKIDAYRNMTADLKRTQGLQVPAAA